MEKKKEVDEEKRRRMRRRRRIRRRRRMRRRRLRRDIRVLVQTMKDIIYNEKKDITDLGPRESSVRW